MSKLLCNQRLVLLIALTFIFSGSMPLTAKALQGGPDAYGYRYIDSNSVGGPQYAWEDIEKTATVYKSKDSNGAGGPFKIGFDFNFYGKSYSSLFIAGNGYVFFSSIGYRNDIYDGSQMPSKSEPNNLIAPFWGKNATFT